MDIRPSWGVALDVLDGRGVLFSEAKQQLNLLDDMATAVWCCLWNEGVSCDEVALQLSRVTGCSSELAAGYVMTCLSQWEVAGFIGLGEANRVQAWSHYQPAKLATPDLDAGIFCVDGIRIAVSCPDSTISDAIDDVIGHLRATDDAPLDCVFEVHSDREGYRAVAPNGNEQSLPDAAAVAVWLKVELLERLLRILPNAIALHAAALLTPAGVMLLAGSSGSGKTTLAAVLNAQGWPSIADDVVLIKEGRSPVGGLPLAYAAKPGSWPLLRNWFPDIDELRSHVRPDSRVVKYIPPRTTVQANQASVTAVVFPHYRPAAPVEVRSFDRVEALVYLLKEARNTCNHLSLDGFLRLSNMVRRSIVLKLDYSNAAEASHELLDMIRARRGER